MSKDQEREFDELDCPHYHGGDECCWEHYKAKLKFVVRDFISHLLKEERTKLITQFLEIVGEDKKVKTFEDHLITPGGINQVKQEIRDKINTLKGKKI